MNNKFFVPFETTKKLKEKGYPQLDNEWYYNLNGEIKLYQDLDEGYKEECPIMLAHYYFATPTYHEVVDWLDTKGVYVEVLISVTLNSKRECLGTEYCSTAFTMSNMLIVKDRNMQYFPTREEALNAAILKALEII